MNLARVTASAFLAYFCVSGVLSTIGLIAEPMSAYFGLEVTQITRGFSGLTLGMWLGSLLSIEVVNRLSIKRVLVLSFGVVSSCLVSLLFVHNVQWVWGLLSAVGIALGVGLAAAALTIARSYEVERRASMLVITDACFSVAGTLCVALTGYWLMQAYHWSAGYVFVGAVALLLVILAITGRYPDETLVSDPASPVLGSEGEEGEQADAPQWSIDVVLCIVALCLYTLGQYAMLWWLPLHLQGALGADPASSGAVVGRFWTGMLFAQLFVAWWVMRVGVTRLLLLGAFLAALCTLPLWMTTTLTLIPWLGLLWGFANLAFLKVAISYATQLQQPPSPRLVSLLLFGATTGTAISPWVTSSIVDALGVMRVLQFSTCCYGLIFVLMVVVVRRNQSTGSALAARH